MAPGNLTFARAKKAIDTHGILLVYPLANKPEPPSLFSVAHPGEKMRWEWTDDADDHVVSLWHLRMRLAESRKVVYAKWFRNRATFFSLPVFRAMLAGVSLHASRAARSPDARDVLAVLQDDSPMSTKALRESAGLRGGEFDRRWQRAIAELFIRLDIVAVGEVADGAFPSLAVGATSLLFEDEWNAREDQADADDTAALENAFTRSLTWKKHWKQCLEKIIATGVDPGPRRSTHSRRSQSP